MHVLGSSFGLRLAVALLAAVAASPAAHAATAPVTHTISSLEELAALAGRDGVVVTMKPGIYAFGPGAVRGRAQLPVYDRAGNVTAQAETGTLLHFSGRGSTYDLYGVIIRFDTRLHLDSTASLDKVLIAGTGNTVRGLELVDVGDTASRGANIRMLHVTGEDNTLEQAGLWVRGSSPYGYGNLLGKGSGSIVPLHKQTSLLITGRNSRILRTRVFTRAFGHGIVMQGAIDTLIRDCYVEGEMRSTDDILKETSGPAHAVGFQSSYPPGRIVPGQMIALSEDGVRAYPDAMRWGQRRTRNITVEDTTVRNMRSGFDLGVASGAVRIAGCSAIECNEKGYAVPSGGVIERSSGDTRYGPLLSLHDRRSRDCRIELEWIERPSAFPPVRMAEINGTGHVIVLRPAADAITGEARPVVLGESFWGDVNSFRDPKVDPLTGATRVRLVNQTRMPVRLTAQVAECEISTAGPLLRDDGQGNRVASTSAAP